MTNNLLIAVDFDGTIAAHAYPLIGREVPNAIRVLKRLLEQNAKLILWTMRSGPELQEAIIWCADRDIYFWSINNNPDQLSWTNSPKVYTQIYINDAALGCPTIFDQTTNRPMVNWRDVEAQLTRRGILI